MGVTSKTRQLQHQSSLFKMDDNSDDKVIVNSLLQIYNNCVAEGRKVKLAVENKENKENIKLQVSQEDLFRVINLINDVDNSDTRNYEEKESKKVEDNGEKDDPLNKVKKYGLTYLYPRLQPSNQ